MIFSEGQNSSGNGVVMDGDYSAAHVAEGKVLEELTLQHSTLLYYSVLYCTVL